MAAPVQKVIRDVGSEEYNLLRKSYNALLDAIAAAVDFADLQALLSTTDDLVKVEDTLELPPAPRFPRF